MPSIALPIVFLGDEVSAAGFRLAGLSVRVPLDGEEQQALAEAAASAELVLITAAFARRLPPALLDRYQSGSRPLVGVVPDVTGGVWPADLAAEIRRHLGIAAGGS
jgi:vacuolar-type H+-ATPase subunit F/Vma7